MSNPTTNSITSINSKKTLPNIVLLIIISGALLISCTKRDNSFNIVKSFSYANDSIQFTDFVGIDSYGQSLSIGGDNNLPNSVVSVTPEYNSVMPDLGVRSLDYPNKKPMAFVPLVEHLNAAGNLGETPCSGACSMFNQVMDVKTFQLFAVASGKSSQSVAELSVNPDYHRLITDVTTANNIAKGMGKTFSLGAVSYIQGEADITLGTSYDTYLQTLSQLNINVNNDVLPITAQSSAIPFVVGQTSSSNRSKASMAYPAMALAQLNLCMNNPNFTMGTPMYMFNYLADNTHLSAATYRILGAYQGYAIKKFIVDGVKNFIYPISTTQINDTITVNFNVPVAPLVFDTMQVVNPGNFGFVVKDSVGTVVRIKSVSIIDGNAVRLICGRKVAELRYAINGITAKAGRLQGPRGCLRDSQGDSIIFDPQGSNWPLYNWTPIFDIFL
ncbi:MAG: hypothetical protein ABJB05_04390 [Parafilimonas sp.]